MVILPAAIKYVPSVKGHLHKGKPAIDLVQTIRTIFTSPTQRAALLFSGALMMGHFLIIPFINPYMEFNLGFSKEQTPLIYMVGGLTTLVSSLIWGRLADRYGKLFIFTIAGLLSVLPIFLITNMPAWPFVLVLVPFAFWFGMANGRTITAQAMLSEVVPPATRGSFMSFNSSVQQLFTGMASTFAGLIVVSDASHRITHYEVLGYISAAIIVLCMVLGRRLGVK
jgi:predicted MFS family arabinose efflux permease